MLPLERIDKIMEILNEQGSVTIEKLAQTMDVSEMTIRRDLEKCKRLGTVHRCHGGAVLKNELVSEMSYEEKAGENRQIKHQLATCCVSLVAPHSTIYLDAGTTTHAIAEHICHIPGLTVVTNDLNIASFLTKTQVEIIVLGGTVQSSTCSMQGSVTRHFLDDIRISIAFLGAMSINDDFDTLTPTLEKAFLKRQVVASANESYLVADSSKFHRQALYRINSLADYTAVITDAQFGEEEKRVIKEKEIKIIIV